MPRRYAPDGTPLYNGKRPEEFSPEETRQFIAETEALLNRKEYSTMIKDNNDENIKQDEYYLNDAPITELAKYAGVSLDEAVNIRVVAAIEAAPPKLDVTVRPIEPIGNLMGYASLKFNNSFVVEDIKILQGENGLFVGMPSKQDGKGGYRDTAKPITAAFRTEIIEAVTETYYAAIEKIKSRIAAPPTAEKKQSVKKQIENGTKKAAEHNKSRSAPTKVNKNKYKEL